jgi:hypothetical protein
VLAWLSLVSAQTTRYATIAEVGLQCATAASFLRVYARLARCLGCPLFEFDYHPSFFPRDRNPVRRSLLLGRYSTVALFGFRVYRAVIQCIRSQEMVSRRLIT